MPTLIFFRAPPPPTIGFPPEPCLAVSSLPLPLLYELPFAEKGTVVVGRSPDCDIILDDHRTSVSRRHLLLSATDGGACRAEDVSTNGTYRNGVQLPKGEPTPLDHADVLNLCGFCLRFVDDRRGCGTEPGIRQRFEPEWRTEHSVGIAAKMADEGDCSALPILADALEEAGCDNLDILAHCRELAVHVRGCWVVNLVLGKEHPPPELSDIL